MICFLICGQLQVILEKESSLSIDLPVKIKFKWNVCQLSTSRFAYNLGTIVWIPSIVLTHAAIQSNVMCSPDGLQSELNINGCLLKQWKPTFVDKWGDEGLEYSSFSTGTSTAFKYLLRASFFFYHWPALNPSEGLKAAIKSKSTGVYWRMISNFSWSLGFSTFILIFMVFPDPSNKATKAPHLFIAKLIWSFLLILGISYSDFEQLYAPLFTSCYIGWISRGRFCPT